LTGPGEMLDDGELSPQQQAVAIYKALVRNVIKARRGNRTIDSDRLRELWLSDLTGPEIARLMNHGIGALRRHATITLGLPASRRAIWSKEKPE
jgi:hypothetical protein